MKFDLKKAGGSLTVEAAVILPFFLFIFLIFLYVIKIFYVQAALDLAVKAAGRDIAAVAYPLSLLHEQEEELFAQGEGMAVDTIPGLSEYAELRAGLPQLLGSGGLNAAAIFEGLLEQGGFALARSVLAAHLETYRLDPAQMTLNLAHLPQSRYGFFREKQQPQYQEAGILPEADFAKEDVVIQAEYSLALPMPFFSGNTVRLKSAVVERAWLAGGNGVYTVRGEKSLFEQAREETGTVVYVTRTGVKYHLSGCLYLRKSRIPLTVPEAQDRGYTPCKICIEGRELFK